MFGQLIYPRCFGRTRTNYFAGLIWSMGQTFPTLVLKEATMPYPTFTNQYLAQNRVYRNTFIQRGKKNNMIYCEITDGTYNPLFIYELKIIKFPHKPELSELVIGI